MFDLQEVIVFVITLLTGIVGVPLIQWVKNALGIEDKAALLLSGGVSLALGAVVVFFSGQFTEISFEVLPEVFTAVYFVANVFYGLFKNGTNVLSRVLGVAKDPNARVG